MSTKLKKHAPLLKWLSESKPKVARTVVKAVDKEVVDVLSECCHNLLKGNVPLNPEEKRKLCRYKKGLRSIACKKTPLKTKKTMLMKGGFLGTLLAPVLRFLGGLLLN